VFEQYRWADIFLYTTKVATDGNRDGTPNVILEAMAAGLPIIAAIHPVICEVITSGENGLIIEQSESEAWIEAITGLIKNNELYNKIRMNGRHWVEENADAHKNTTRLYQKFKNAANA
jgi:glycosyltransferase involved in cell wall biosynthesis